MSKKTITTPFGLAVYPHLNRPDTKWDPEGYGHFKVGLKLDPSDEKVAKFLEGIKDLEERVALEHAIEETGKPKGKLKQGNSVIRQDEDENGKETGFVIVNFKTKAGGMKDGQEWKRKLPVVGPDLKPLEASVGGGSTIRVAFMPKPYFMPTSGYGIAMYLEMVQVKDLVEYGGGVEEAFDALEDGEPDGNELELDPANF